MNLQAYTITEHPEWACIYLKAPDSENLDQRTPVHLCCVIDNSGSMLDSDKLEHVKKSLQFLLDFLGPQDQISVITFSERVKTILSQTFMTSGQISHKEHIRSRISFILPETSTNLSAGLIETHESLRSDVSNVKQGILLLTDGHATTGITEPDALVQLTRTTLQTFQGTSLSCIGYGVDHNASLLQRMSAEGGGSYYVVNSLEDVATVFGDVLGGLASCSYQQVRILLPEGTELKTRYPMETSNHVIKVMIGDLPAGMEAVIIAKLPQESPILLKAFHLGKQATLTLSTTIGKLDDLIAQVNGNAHYLRFEVVALLEETNAMYQTASRGKREEQIQKIVACTNQIRTCKMQNPHTLWDMLLDELQNSKILLEDRRQSSLQPMLVQRGACLGMMRGIGASPSAHSSQATQATQATDAFLSPMARQSNRVQRLLSTQLCDSLSASQVEEEPGAYKPKKKYNPKP